MKNLEQKDKVLAEAIWNDPSRQQDKIELIASQIFVSQALEELAIQRVPFNIRV